MLTIGHIYGVYIDKLSEYIKKGGVGASLVGAMIFTLLKSKQFILESIYIHYVPFAKI